MSCAVRTETHSWMLLADSLCQEAAAAIVTPNARRTLPWFPMHRI